MARVLFWRLAFLLAMAVAALAAAVMWLPRRLLVAMCAAMDRAEVCWIQACSDRRVAERRRVNVADQIRPLPGAANDRR